MGHIISLSISMFGLVLRCQRIGSLF